MISSVLNLGNRAQKKDNDRMYKRIPIISLFAIGSPFQSEYAYSTRYSSSGRIYCQRKVDGSQPNKNSKSASEFKILQVKTQNSFTQKSGILFVIYPVWKVS